MRYFWALLAYVTSIIVAVASCSGGGVGSTHTSGNNGGGGSQGTPSSGHGGTGSGTANGGGGSTGSLTLPDSGTPAEAGPCAAFKDCTAQGIECGATGDGCGNILQCGSCATNQVCNGGKCDTICTPQTCQQQGYQCGMATDGCNTPIDCGPCTGTMTCGAGNQCGNGSCTPQTCGMQGFTCGMQGNGCGGTPLDCGSCPTGQVCGPKGKCITGTTCTPTTSCASQGLNCGQTTDNCGNILTCGPACGAGGGCTNLCPKQQACDGGTTTSVSGTVYSPNGTDVLPGVLVYVPNSPVLPFKAGVSCGSCGADVSGSPLVSAVTDYKGTFTITNMPVAKNVPLVIQKGRWRRQFTIDNVPACTNTPLPTAAMPQLRMPQTDTVHAGGEGDIPLMAFVTGNVDALECVLRKIGIADSEFSDPSGTGRVRFYLGGDGTLTGGGPGASYSASTPNETTLWGSQTTINQYDMVYFACQGGEYQKTAAQQAIVENYANAGGRVFATHYSYVWLYNQVDAVTPANSFQNTASWKVDPNVMNTFVNDPQTGYINTTFTRGQLMANWLQFIGASTTAGQIQIGTLRDDFTGVLGKSVLWINVNDVGTKHNKGLGNVPMHYTFDTPVSAAPANQCGRVLYSDFHVEDAVTGGSTFPDECVVADMTPQEKMLEFMIFDLGSCVTPPTCAAKTCGDLHVACGPAGDGCGNILQCGACPSGQSCISGTCGSGCTPLSCADQHYTCGKQGDGCGNIIDCGACTSGTCGGGGTNGQCGNGSCTPKGCPAGVMCGFQSDGCGNTINCGACPSGQSCGGGGTPGQCGSPMCTPKSCTDQHFTCGMATDGCGNTINCGTCAAGYICGGGIPPVANVCGMPPP